MLSFRRRVQLLDWDCCSGRCSEPCCGGSIDLDSGGDGPDGGGVADTFSTSATSLVVSDLGGRGGFLGGTSLYAPDMGRRRGGPYELLGDLTGCERGGGGGGTGRNPLCLCSKTGWEASS